MVKLTRRNYAASSKLWMVELENIGEGNCGEYNPADKHDEPLMRFTFYSRTDARRKWAEKEDGSYCTQLNADSIERNPILRAKIVTYLLQQVMDLNPADSIKKLGERLSWISAETFTKSQKESR